MSNFYGYRIVYLLHEIGYIPMSKINQPVIRIKTFPNYRLNFGKQNNLLQNRMSAALTVIGGLVIKPTIVMIKHDMFSFKPDNIRNAL